MDTDDRSDIAGRGDLRPVDATDSAQNRFRSLLTLIERHAAAAMDHDSEPGADDRSERVQASPSRSINQVMVRWLLILKTLPWLYGLGFLVSFWWDFDGMAWTWGTAAATDPMPSGSSWPDAMRISFEGLLRVVSVGGMIGFLTNWLAITMLFRPSRRRPLLGHGLIPANKERIAMRLARSVAEDLINPEVIKRKIHESGWIRIARLRAVEGIRSVVDREAFREDLKQWVRQMLTDLVSDPQIRADVAVSVIRRMEELLEDRFLERFAYRAYQFLKGSDAQRIVEEAIGRVPEMVDEGLDRIDDLLDELPSRLEQDSEQIEEWFTALLFRLVNRLDVEELVLDNLIRYDEKRVERMIRGATHEQLHYIQYLGALLGGIGGLVIWNPVLSLGLMTLLGGLVFAADHLILKWMESRRTGGIADNGFNGKDVHS